MQQLIAPWRFLGRAVILFFEELYLMVLISLLSSLAILTLVLAPAAAAGLIHITTRMIAAKRVSLDFFWEGAKSGWKMTYKVMSIWGGVMILLGINVLFYALRFSGSIRYFSGFWGYLAILWLAIGFYLLPLLQHMPAPTVKSVYVNAFVLAFRQPLYTLTLLFQFVLLTLLWRYLPPLALLVWPGLLALLVSFATHYGLLAILHEEDMPSEGEGKPK
jgi:uncharacterized membrane protein YesL